MARQVFKEDLKLDPASNRWLELLAGDLFTPDPDATAFESDEERRAVWEANRDELIAAAIRMEPGRRPWAFWHYEAGKHFEDDEDRLSYLAANGDLSRVERTAIAQAATEAEIRIGTEAERGWRDWQAVKLGELVT